MNLGDDDALIAVVRVPPEEKEGEGAVPEGEGPEGVVPEGETPEDGAPDADALTDGTPAPEDSPEDDSEPTEE